MLRLQLGCQGCTRNLRRKLWAQGRAEQRCSQEAVCQLDLEHMDDTHEDGNPVHASIMPASSSHKQAASFQTVAKGSIGTGLLVQAQLSCTNM